MTPIASQIRKFPNILRDHIKEIGATCPYLCETRWISMWSIISFVDTHPKAVAFLAIPEHYEEFRDITLIFQALIEIFEDSKTPLATVFHVLQNALNAFHELSENGSTLALEALGPLQNYPVG
jgi:hypothetical protein